MQEDRCSKHSSCKDQRSNDHSNHQWNSRRRQHQRRRFLFRQPSFEFTEPLIIHTALLAPELIPLYLFAEAREKFGKPLASALADDGAAQNEAKASAIAAAREYHGIIKSNQRWSGPAG